MRSGLLEKSIKVGQNQAYKCHIDRIHSSAKPSMPLIPKDRDSKQWKQFVAWLVGTLVMPFSAYPFIQEMTENIGFDSPVIVVFSVAWALASFALYLFIKSNVN
jgi:hypothetical protein